MSNETPKPPAKPAAKTPTKTTAAKKATGPRPVEQTIRLAQNIQVRDEQGIILLRAGTEVVVGTKPGQVDPAWLAHQPMLDLEHERNQKSITKRQAVLTRVRKAQEEAKKRGHHAVQRVGQRERRFGEHGIV